jgi:hypothetical protein
VKSVWLIGVLILATSSGTACIAQRPARSKQAPPDTEALSKPVAWGPENFRLFKDSKTDMVFTLATSWIPGANHKGMFRYRMTAFPVKPPLAEQAADPQANSPEATEALIDRVHACTLSIALYDKDDFLLRNVDTTFVRVTNSDAQVVGLNTNSFEQMDAEEYRKLVGDPSKSGRWELAWACNK